MSEETKDQIIERLTHQIILLEIQIETLKVNRIIPIPTEEPIYYKQRWKNSSSLYTKKN